jgi:hypothetical protein
LKNVTELLMTGTVPAAIFAAPDRAGVAAGSCFSKHDLKSKR